jgi:hypothetical protein
MTRSSPLSAYVSIVAGITSLFANSCGWAFTPAPIPSPDNRIDPIAPSRSWTYEVQVFGSSSVCSDGRHSATVRKEAVVDGKHAYKIESFCPGLGASYYAVEGDRVELDYRDTWVLLLDGPVEEGHSWTNGVSVFTWHNAGSVTVPAGTFSDCWKATETANFSAYTVFCRGVGPVHWYRKDSVGNGFDAQLVAKGF